MNSLVTIASFESAADAEIHKLLLDEEGIVALVAEGDPASPLSGTAGTVALQVAAEDAEKATGLLVRFRATQAEPAQQPAAEQKPTAAARLQSAAQFWPELAAVFCLAVLPDLVNSVMLLAGGSGTATPNARLTYVAWIVRSVQVSVPLLVIVARSGAGWESCGIVQPKWRMDLATGAVIWFVGWWVAVLAMLLMPERMLRGVAQAAGQHLPHGVLDCLLVVLASLSNGFAEEFAMRGFLLTRLEAALRSTWAAVLLSTLAFASYHIYQGIGGAIVVAVTSLIYAAAFCLGRRLWPVCVAHALSNCVSLLFG